MSQSLILNKSISINASSAKVWDALTNPEIIKQYFFGTECISTWEKGSSIIFKGIYEGKAYEDKGIILDIKPGEFILYNYWSSFSGTPDIPENYAPIKYAIASSNNQTILTVTQEGFANEEAVEHSKNNWGFILEGLKKIVENR